MSHEHQGGGRIIQKWEISCLRPAELSYLTSLKLGNSYIWKRQISAKVMWELIGGDPTHSIKLCTVKSGFGFNLWLIQNGRSYLVQLILTLTKRCEMKVRANLVGGGNYHQMISTNWGQTADTHHLELTWGKLNNPTIIPSYLDDKCFAIILCALKTCKSYKALYLTIFLNCQTPWQLDHCVGGLGGGHGDEHGGRDGHIGHDRQQELQDKNGHLCVRFNSGGDSIQSWTANLSWATTWVAPAHTIPTGDFFSFLLLPSWWWW